MIQRFIELGEGYSDLYELFEIASSNEHRLSHLLRLEATKDKKRVASFVVILHPTMIGKFQPLYICREGIQMTEDKESKRIALFDELGVKLNKKIIPFEVKASNMFHEKEIYFNHVIGILRMNRIIPPLQ